MNEPEAVFVHKRPVFAAPGVADELGLTKLHPMSRDARLALVDAVWIEASINDEWTAAFRLLVQNGFPIVAEIRIFPCEKDRKFRERGEWSALLLGNHAKAPKGGITTPLLRQVTLGVVRREITETLKVIRKNAPDLLASHFPHVLPERRKTRKKKKDERGRPSIPDIEYARLAAYYAERCQHGSESPIKDTFQKFETRIPRLSIAKVRSRLHEARRRDLLTYAPSQGVGFGKLTEKATRLLATQSSTTKKGDSKHGK